MSEDEKKLYELLNTQFNLVFNRAQVIEAKAINVALFTGVVLGLEYTILYNFSSNILIENKDFLFYLVAISSSFLFSSILLVIISILESHNFHFSDILCSNITCDNDELIKELSNRIENNIIEYECKIESKERFLKWSLISFISGVFVIIWLFDHIMRYSLHS